MVKKKEVTDKGIEELERELELAKLKQTLKESETTKENIKCEYHTICTEYRIKCFHCERNPKRSYYSARKDVGLFKKMFSRG